MTAPLPTTGQVERWLNSLSFAPRMFTKSPNHFARDWREKHAARLRELAADLPSLVERARRADELEVANRALHEGISTKWDRCRATEARLAEAEAERDRLTAALEKAMEWAAGYPLGGDMDRNAANDVYWSAQSLGIGAARSLEGGSK